MFPWLEIDIGTSRWKVDHRTGITSIYGATIALWLFGVLAPLVALIPFNLLSPNVAGDAALLRIHLVAIALAIVVTWLAGHVIERQKEIRQDKVRELAAAAVAEALRLGDCARRASEISFLRLCADLRGGGKENLAQVAARALFLQRLSSSDAAYYLGAGDSESEAAQYVALLTDFPPRWVLDAATDRTGARAKAKEKKNRS